MEKVIFVMLVFCLFSCGLNERNKEVSVDKEKGILRIEENNNHLINDPRSPNPSSELAVAMRNMWEYADTMKMQILDSTSQDLSEYRSKFDDILIARPTDEHTKKPSFDAMAKIMLQRLDRVYQNTGKEQSVQVEGFNLFVQSCLQCHQQQCPGPVSKISKLLIPKEK
ncbi:hypothetical protein [Bernardetia sp.]|uniref:hypothetical protein n=1 Tax=Bernardetia sp. TaxID=1937974 RepID=UPI0025BBE023|nr:hypothetical protein [Bernardetia sp.]